MEAVQESVARQTEEQGLEEHSPGDGALHDRSSAIRSGALSGLDTLLRHDDSGWDSHGEYFTI
jgi:hypothetical protein